MTAMCFGDRPPVVYLYPMLPIPSLSDFRALLKLALPMVVVQVGLMMMGVVDTIIVGHVSATELAAALAGRTYARTRELIEAIRAALPKLNKDDSDLTVRRVFQALRIAVNDEFGALDTLLRHLPACLNPGGRVAILTFHSGEDRRVKKAFAAGLREGVYADIAHEVIRPAEAERRDNSRSSAAKLRWARRAG